MSPPKFAGDRRWIDAGLNARMGSSRRRRDLRTNAARGADRLRGSIGAELRRARQDAGLSLRDAAGAAGVDPSFLSLVERGLAEASWTTLLAVATVLGLELSVRLYATTGSRLRDRHQAAIVERLLADRSRTWTAAVEVAVSRPARGVIDVVLARPGLLLAVEVHSELRSVEQVIRWAADKADGLPSSVRWNELSGAGSARIDRLLVVRSTRHNRAVVRGHARTFRTAYPGDAQLAVAAVIDGGGWPGASLVWTAPDADAPRLLRRPSVVLPAEDGP
jgi:transcriptional regulator with XRE-family HTH domain